MADHTGGMVALIPTAADLARLAVPGGDPPEQLHLTLVYLGDDVTTMPPELTAAIHTVVRNSTDHAAMVATIRAENDGELPGGGPPVFPGQEGPITGEVFSHAVFNPNGDNGFEAATVYLLDGKADRPDIDFLAGNLTRVLTDTLGEVNMPTQHSPFVPHITAGYNLPVDQLTYTGPVTFDRLRVALANSYTDYPLGGTKEDTMPEQDAAGIPVTFPVLAVEGISTSDGRYIEPGGLTTRPLPLPILAQTETPDGGSGHDGAYVIGRLDTAERVPGPSVVSRVTGKPFPEGTFVWQGSGYIDPDHDAANLVQRGYLTGNSVDLSEIEAFIEADPNHQELDDDEPEGVKIGGSTGERVRLTKGTIAATTLVAIPAFADAYVLVNGETVQPAVGLTAAAVPAWRATELGDNTCLPCAEGEDGFAVTQAKRDKAESKGHAMPGGRYPIDTEADLDNAIRAVGRAGGKAGTEQDRNQVRRHIIKQAKRLGLEAKIPDSWSPDGTLKTGHAALLAAARTQLPPIAVFRNPELPGPTPLTVTDDGRVYGHLAAWGTCHTSYTGQCVLAPRSTCDYAYFRTGARRVLGDDGEPTQVNIGKLTVVLNPDEDGHANGKLGALPAAAHYDNVATAVADVEIGEDTHGIWVAGALRATATRDQVEALMSSTLSGDWRPVNGRLELVAALGVNTGGFPIPRARVASGQVVSLVAAGAVPRETPEWTPALEAWAVHIADKVAAKLGVQVPKVPDDDIRSDLAARRAAVLADMDEAALEARWADAMDTLES